MTPETILLETLDGVNLDGELAVPTSPWAAAALCHPHPLYGGSMTNVVIEALFRALPAAGIAAVRFDFRGVGRSEGAHDDGDAERLDAAAAIEAVAPFAFDGPVVLCGYSFGGLVALDVVHPRLAGWFAVAAPLGPTSRAVAAGDHRPKLLLAPEHDQFSPPAVVRAATGGWTSTSVVELSGADHFLAGRAALAAEHAVGFLTSLR